MQIRKKTATLLVLCMILLCSCEQKVDLALKFAGDNRQELEKVLDHFKNDPDPLKYKAAKFLIENMPYHHALYGDIADQYAEAYATMAKHALEFRDSVINAETQQLTGQSILKVSDIRKMKADFLIKAIDEACDVWEKSNWRNDYDESTFFNYVLPYRLSDEPVSDWRQAIKTIFPYLDADVVYSDQGIPFPAFSEQISNARVIDSPNSLKGKAVQIFGKNSSVTYIFPSDMDVQKIVRLRSSALAVDTKAMVELNGQAVGTVDLRQVNSEYSFKTSLPGIVLNLQKGENRVTIRFANKPFTLDYIEVAAFEPYHDENAVDYSDSYCQIQNVGTSHYVSFDTVRSTIGQPIELHEHSPKDMTLNMRFDYQGYPCWRIVPMDPADLYLEDYRVSLDTMAIVSKQIYIWANNPDRCYEKDVTAYQSRYINHQKWVIMPVGDGMCKIMNKQTGLFWESRVDNNTGKEILVQNFYSGKATQKWKIIKKGKNPYAQSFFRIGNAQSEAVKVTDVMDLFDPAKSRGSVTPSLASLCRYRTGPCKDEASYVAALSRYMGIPVAIDFTPHWGNRTNNHTWNALVLPNGKATPFYMGYVPGDTTQFTHSPVYLKPKVYRYRFEVNQKIVDDLKGEKNIPELFRLPTFTDVTDEYLNTTDVVRNLPDEFRDSKIAYICVNDKEQWIPVHYGKVSHGKVTFTSMGRNILYSVGIWQDNSFIPVGNPFILKPDGSTREIKCDNNKRQTMTLLRKYPFFAQFDSFRYRMNMGEFQGSNAKDFSQSTVLYQHQGYTDAYWYELEPEKVGNKYRYLRYIGSNDSYCNINEIEFFDSKGQKLTGKVLGTQGMPGHTKETVFDGDILTGFNGISPDGHWVGLELAQPSDVAKIRFIPRNDGNCIEVGDMYQLLMYDRGKWIELAELQAQSNKIVLEDMPSDGLYLLKDLTKGIEERIFTYENGEQVWW